MSWKRLLVSTPLGFLAIAAAGFVDLIILSAILYALLSWRARRKVRA